MMKGVDYIGVTVVFLCHDGRGNILMHRRSAECRDEQGGWDIGGGGLDHGESVEDGVIREITEEYGVQPKVITGLGYRDVHRVHAGTRTHWVALDFAVEVPRKSVLIGEPHKFEEIAWYTIDNLPDKMHSQLPVFFEQYQKTLKELLLR